MNDLYIHIGTHKTGTTTIQHALNSSKRVLKKEKIVLIPRFPKSYILRNMDFYDPNLAIECTKYLEKQCKRYINKNYKLIMSYEGFSGDQYSGYSNTSIIAKHIKAITTKFNTKIIVYIRRQDQFIQSLYTQYIHSGGYLNFSQFIEKHIKDKYFDWYEFINIWVEYYGKENVIVRPYAHQYFYKGDIIKDFGKILGSEYLKQSSIKMNSNMGYSRDAVELARLVNPLINKDENKYLRYILQSVSAKEPFKKYSYWTIKENKNWMSLYRQSNIKVNTDYFEGKCDELFKCDENIKEDDSYSFDIESASRLFILILLEMRRTPQRPSIHKMTIIVRVKEMVLNIPIFGKFSKIVFKKVFRK
jgi:hypothetical protein